MQVDNPIIDELTSITANESLAVDVYNSIDVAVDTPFVEIGIGMKVWNVFERSLNVAMRDIEKHPRGILFQRLVQYGADRSKQPGASQDNPKTVLSDEECGSCLEFIHSHIVTRFKGELAELLALTPCIRLLEQLFSNGLLAPATRLYWADEVQERWKIRDATESEETKWGSFTKGADGLLAQPTNRSDGCEEQSISVQGVVEVKSISLSRNRILAQIDRHVSRLSGGVSLGGTAWPPEVITVDKSSFVRILVVPRTRRSSRSQTTCEVYGNERTAESGLSEPQAQNVTMELSPGVWQISLGWSQEELDEAAHAMTYWYMSQVGIYVDTRGCLPTIWDHMGSEEAGRNAMKEALYYMLLRPITTRQQRIATRLYNIFSFTYPVGTARAEMLWSDHTDNL